MAAKYHDWKLSQPEEIIPRNAGELPRDVFFIQIRTIEFILVPNPKSNNAEDEYIRRPAGHVTTSESFWVKKDSLLNDEEDVRTVLYNSLKVMGIPDKHRMSLIEDIKAFGRSLEKEPSNAGRDVLPILLGFATTEFEPIPKKAKYADKSYHEWKFWQLEEIIPRSGDFPGNVFFIQIRTMEVVLRRNPQSNSVEDEYTEQPVGDVATSESFWVKKDSLLNDEEDARTILCHAFESMGIPVYLLMGLIEDIEAFGRSLVDKPSNLGRGVLPILVGFAAVDMETADEICDAIPEKVKKD